MKLKSHLENYNKHNHPWSYAVFSFFWNNHKLSILILMHSSSSNAFCIEHSRLNVQQWDRKLPHKWKCEDEKRREKAFLRFKTFLSIYSLTIFPFTHIFCLFLSCFASKTNWTSKKTSHQFLCLFFYCTKKRISCSSFAFAFGIHFYEMELV